jgi:hypothetical protein
VNGADSITVELVADITDDVRMLIGELDQILSAEYMPEQRHGLGGARQVAALRFYERAGFQICAAFGGYATMAPQAIATSVFLQKLLRK